MPVRQQARGVVGSRGVVRGGDCGAVRGARAGFPLWSVVDVLSSRGLRASVTVWGVSTPSSSCGMGWVSVVLASRNVHWGLLLKRAPAWQRHDVTDGAGPGSRAAAPCHVTAPLQQPISFQHTTRRPFCFPSCVFARACASNQRWFCAARCTLHANLVRGMIVVHLRRCCVWPGHPCYPCWTPAPRLPLPLAVAADCPGTARAVPAGGTCTDGQWSVQCRGMASGRVCVALRGVNSNQRQ